MSEPAERRIYSVAELNHASRLLLEGGLGVVWVEGELSNFARPSSGHWYFSLKDRDAQVRCAMFRARNVLSTVAPEEGMQLLARGRISLYEPRGDYQLIVEHLELAGIGALQRAFEQLKARLQAEGLFAAERKRPLPTLPATVGVITSPTGAAIRDILHIMARRFPATRVIIYPVPVQGSAAPAAIAAALDLANARAECDVLILARGGGSLEDLQAFNDERVARALARSTLPVVSGVGHEVDFTIADFVADARAPTPSGAAQLVTQDVRAWLQRLAQIQERLQALWRRREADAQQVLRALQERLQRAHPGARLAQHAQRLDELEQRRQRAWERLLLHARSRLEGVMRALHAVSPLATLERGFAIVQGDGDARAVTDVAQLRVGQRIQARLAHGRLHAEILSLEAGDPS
jgi:exodeoxyribonuclease VII large subunit